MGKRLALLIGGWFLVPGTVYAYVGPGAGLSLLGALWALVLAIGAAIVFIVAWPLRRMRRRKREAQAAKAQQQGANKPDVPGTGTKQRAPQPPNDAVDSAAPPQASVVRQKGADRSQRQ